MRRQENSSQRDLIAFKSCLEVFRPDIRFICGRNKGEYAGFLNSAREGSRCLRPFVAATAFRAIRPKRDTRVIVWSQWKAPPPERMILRGF
jgi:hypothetical protein